MNICTPSLLALVMVAFAIMLNSCSEERPLGPIPENEPVVHENWENEEAEEIAVLISGSVAAPRPLYERVQRELKAIRESWGDSIPQVVSIVGRAPFRSQITMAAERDIVERIKAGLYRDWDSLNAMFGTEISYLDNYIQVSVPTRVNIWRLMQSYESLPGVTNLWPSGGMFFDGPTLYAHMEGDQTAYLFRDAWGDCPSGCIYSHYYYFKSDRSGIQYLGDWLAGWPRTPEPNWWVSAQQARVLWELGDPEYRFRDATAPGRTTDLRAVGLQMARNAKFEFTAPGDLGLTGNAESYVFRWGPDSVTEANWYSLPTAAFFAEKVGTRVTLTLRTLPALGRYVVAMRAVDKLGNLSPVSNLVTTENVLQFGWTYFNSDNSPLPDNEVTALYIDSKNRAWVGTDFGVTVLHAGGGESYNASAHSIFSQRVTAISEDAMGHIVIGTRAGAASFDGDTWRTVWPLGPETQDREVRCIFPADDGTVWLGVGFNGAVEIDDQSWESHNSSNSGIRGSIVRRMVGSSDGSIWFGAEQGLSRLLDGTWTASGATGTVTSIFLPDPETLLYGTYDGMLHCISHGINRTPIKMSPHETWPRQSATIGDIVQSGDGSIWLSTYGSIRRYNLDSLTESLVVLPSISGLPDREITALAAGPDNTLWIGTQNAGVCRWDLTAAGMPASATTLSSNR